MRPTRVLGTDIGRYARTAVQLKPGQVVHRAKLRAQRTALRHWPDAGRRLLAGPDPAGAVGWPASFVPIDARASLPWPGLAELSSGWIELLGVARRLGDVAGGGAIDWQQPDAPLLWRLHLHYWDWGWGLAGSDDRKAATEMFGQLWRSWLDEVPFGRGDAWRPYPAALRAWSWCGQYGNLVAGGDLQERFVVELATHAGFVRRHLECDIGGNHLIKDLKALIGLAAFFTDGHLLQSALRRLTRQITVQVLRDGGHYERAPAYHCQVLADLIDVAGLLEAMGTTPSLELSGAIERMRSWLDCVLSADGRVPLLNDGYPVADSVLAALREEVPQPSAAAPGAARPTGPLVVLPDTGLVRAAVGGWQLLADVGVPCPDELPGHAHADTFGCLAHVHGVPLLVDTGTSTYAPGPVRDYERSTAAHSTLQIDGVNSTEVWGAFRAGRRARVRDVIARATADTVIIEAAHDGYRSLPGAPVHRRRWELTESTLHVYDEVVGAGQHAIAVRWYLAPDIRVQIDPAGVSATVMLGAAVPISVDFKASSELTLEAAFAPVALGFGRTVVAPVLICRINAGLPVWIGTRWSRASDGHLDRIGPERGGEA